MFSFRSFQFPKNLQLRSSFQDLMPAFFICHGEKGTHPEPGRKNSAQVVSSLPLSKASAAFHTS